MARTPTITPLLRYRDVRAAAQWLCQAFGFEQHHVSTGAEDQIHYISLRLGASFVLVCPATSSAFDDLMVQPGEINGANTQLCYLTVANLDEHRSRARAQGARIEIAPQDDGAGGRFYTCRDLEDHLWSFGTRAYSLGGPAREKRIWRSRSFRGAGIVSALALAIGGGMLHKADVGGTSMREDGAIATGSFMGDRESREELAAQRALRLSSERTAKAATDGLKAERAAGSGLRQTLQRAQTERSQLQRAKEEADRAVQSSEARVQEHLQARARAEQALAAARAALESEERRALSAEHEMAQVRLARQAAEESLAETVAALTAERARAAQAQEAQAALQETAAKAEAAVLAERQAKAQLEQERALLTQTQEAHAALQETVAKAEAAVLAERQARARGQEERASLREELANQQHEAILHQEQLQQVKSALLSAQQEVAALRPPPPLPLRAVGQQEAKNRPTVMDDPAGRSPSACVSAVQGRVPLHRGSSAWDAASLARLCGGAESSVEPARCFEELAQGKISWGGGRVWSAVNALALCGGTGSASRTLGCFAAAIAAGQPWRTAIGRCRAS